VQPGQVRYPQQSARCAAPGQFGAAAGLGQVRSRVPVSHPYGVGEIDPRALASGILQSGERGPMFFMASGTTKQDVLAALGAG